MADGTIDSELIELYDIIPGYARRTPSAPTGGYAGSANTNTAAVTAKIGEKQWIYNESAGINGWSCFVYLQIGTQNGSVAIAVKSAVVPDSASKWYQMTNDPDDNIKLPTQYGAIALAAITDAYYGWFWCAGACPEEHVSGLGGNYKTNGTLAAGDFCYHNLSADEIGLDLAGSAVNEPGCGFALADDS